MKKRIENWPGAFARAGVIVAALAATACVPLEGGMGFLATQNGPNDAGIRGLLVRDGAIKVRSPDGFCIDQRSSRASTGFVVMAGCAIVSSTKVMPQTHALITVQVGESGSAVVVGAEEELKELFQSEAGGALLSHSGDTAAVSVKEVVVQGAAVVVGFHDSAAPSVEGLTQDEWRAFFDLGGRLVTIAVRGYDHSPINDSQAKSLLSSAIETTVEANPPVETLASQ